MHRRDEGGDRSLHVDGTTAAQRAVTNRRGERIEGPGFGCAGRHHISMAGKTEIGAAVAAPGVEIVNWLITATAKDQPMADEAKPLQCRGDDVERAFVLRGDAGPADQRGGQRRRIESGLAHSRNSSLIEVLARVPSSTFLTMTAQ